jgi:hypothetical protein
MLMKMVMVGPVVAGLACPPSYGLGNGLPPAQNLPQLEF